MIETGRLILRRWWPEDVAPYAEMMADPEVGDWLGGTMTLAQAEQHVADMTAVLAARAFGILAIEQKSDGKFVGSAGLAPVRADIPFAPAVEIGWRLARRAWGNGYATEAARALLKDGFERLELDEIVTFTTSTNLRSQAVMRRLGLTRDPTRDFDHPKLAVDHPLRPHIVYAARRL